MHRRSFLKGAASSALLPAFSWADSSCPAAVAELTSKSFSKSPYGGLNENLPVLYRQSSAILLGQHAHTDPLPLAYIFSNEHIRMMKESGKEHLVTEFPVELQSAYDAVAQGSKSVREMATSIYIPWLSPRDSMGLMMAIGRGLIEMNKVGINFHCCDTSLTEVSAEDLKAFNDFMRGKAQEDKAANKRLLDARLDDRKRINLIHTRTGDEGFIAVMGALHFENHPHSMKSLLGNTTLAHINLHRDQDSYIEAQEKYCAYKSEFIALVETGKLYQTGSKALPHISQLAKSASLRRPVPAIA